MAFQNPTSNSSLFGTMDAEFSGESDRDFFGSALALDSDAILISDKFNSPPHQCDVSSRSKIGFSQSPESILLDSSSDSSLQRPRHGSSDSSHSEFIGGDVTMVDEEQAAAWSAVDTLAGQYCVNAKISNTDATLSDVAMDKVFDFDSAASSPGPHTTKSDVVFNSSPNFAKMPYRSSPGSGFMSNKPPSYWPPRSAVRVARNMPSSNILCSHYGAKAHFSRTQMINLSFLPHLGINNLRSFPWYSKNQRLRTTNAKPKPTCLITTTSHRGLLTKA